MGQLQIKMSLDLPVKMHSVTCLHAVSDIGEEIRSEYRLHRHSCNKYAHCVGLHSVQKHVG